MKSVHVVDLNTQQTKSKDVISFQNFTWLELQKLTEIPGNHQLQHFYIIAKGKILKSQEDLRNLSVRFASENELTFLVIHLPVKLICSTVTIDPKSIELISRYNNDHPGKNIFVSENVSKLVDSLEVADRNSSSLLQMARVWLLATSIHWLNFRLIAKLIIACAFFCFHGNLKERRTLIAMGALMVYFIQVGALTFIIKYIITKLNGNQEAGGENDNRPLHNAMRIQRHFITEGLLTLFQSGLTVPRHRGLIFDFYSFLMAFLVSAYPDWVPIATPIRINNHEQVGQQRVIPANN